MNRLTQLIKELVLLQAFLLVFALSATAMTSLPLQNAVCELSSAGFDVVARMSIVHPRNSDNRAASGESPPRRAHAERLPLQFRWPGITFACVSGNQSIKAQVCR
jgi:hypothetical protein